MKVEHVAIWVSDLEIMKEFYQKYFHMSVNELYTNESKGYSSYFLSFPTGTRIELMYRNDIQQENTVSLGFAHLAISLGSEEKVTNLTETLRTDGYIIQSEPRRTGDGYFESVILDPEGNHIEITV